MENPNTVLQIMEALHQRKIEFAIDDFGTGYSSLAYLEKLPVQYLKIDRTFINALTEQSNHNENASEIVKATIALAHNLNIKVVAEGIETQEQLQMLCDFSCDLGQGYFYAKPLNKKDATDFILGNHPKATDLKSSQQQQYIQREIRKN